MSRYFVVGSLNMDHALRLVHLPEAGETVSALAQSFTPGGKGANQAVALARLGLTVRMVGAVGQDPYGDVLLARLGEEGVDVGSVERRGDDSGMATVLVTEDGQSTIVVAAGANGRLLPADVPTGLAGLTAGDVVVAQLEIPLPVVAEALRLARTEGALTVLDPAPASVEARALLPLVDLVAPNRHEAAILTGRSVASVADAREAGRELLRLGARQALVKLDRDGAILVTTEGETPVAAQPVAAVDATAAGDAFLAAYLAGLEEGMATSAALALAAQAGALTATRPGAMMALPRREDLLPV